MESVWFYVRTEHLNCATWQCLSCFCNVISTLTNPLILANNSHFPGKQSLLSTSQLLSNLSNGTFEPQCAKHGLHKRIPIDTQFSTLQQECLVFQIKVDPLVTGVVVSAMFSHRNASTSLVRPTARHCHGRLTLMSPIFGTNHSQYRLH